jgi:hypothetical protein
MALFGAIRRNRMRQKNAGAEQNKYSCSKLDHRKLTVCGPAQQRLSRTWPALTSERLVRYLPRRERSVPRFLCLKPGRVHFLRQADQVSDCQERAHANESRQGRVSHQLEKMRGQIKAAGRNIGSGPVASAK